MWWYNIFILYQALISNTCAIRHHNIIWGLQRWITITILLWNRNTIDENFIEMITFPFQDFRVWPSYHLHNKNSYAGHVASVY